MGDFLLVNQNQKRGDVLMKWWTEFFGGRKRPEVAGKCGRVVFLLSLSFFVLSDLVSSAEPIDWPKPMAEWRNFKLGAACHSRTPAFFEDPCLARYISQEDDEAIDAQFRLSQRREALKEIDNRRSSGQWEVWFSLFMSLLY